MNPLDGALCVGRTKDEQADLARLFESTAGDDHREAAFICAQCPAIAACRKLVPPGTEFPSGTWAGTLYGRVRGQNKPLNPGGGLTFKERIAAEDAMFTPAEALAAHNAYKRGDTSERAAIGERVYDRNRKRRTVRGERLTVDCRECGRHRVNVGRGLCSGCYKRWRKTEERAA